MKKYLKEFQQFAVKGNVVDLAVAVIIGGAFGKIVSSLVADIVMPAIGVIVGGLNFTNLKIVLKGATVGAKGIAPSPAIIMNVGIFIQNIFDFLIIAVSIFFMVKLIGKIKNRLVKEEEKEEKLAPSPTEDQKLLMEIRDLLKDKK